MPIVGANYHDPFLGLWTVRGFDHHAVLAIAHDITRFNTTLEETYASLGVPLADIETEFSATDLETTVHLRRHGDVPLGVARTCQWTPYWMPAAW